MTGVATVFKRVYGEALAPYGFFKIKGRQPYFGRLIGDEIIHIITFKNEYSFNQYYKAFDILGGITTVYSFIWSWTRVQETIRNGWMIMLLYMAPCIYLIWTMNTGKAY